MSLCLGRRSVFTSAWNSTSSKASGVRSTISNQTYSCSLFSRCWSSFNASGGTRIPCLGRAVTCTATTVYSTPLSRCKWGYCLLHFSLKYCRHDDWLELLYPQLCCHECVRLEAHSSLKGSLQKYECALRSRSSYLPSPTLSQSTIPRKRE